MKPYYEENGITIYNGDSRAVLPTLAEGSVNCCVTSPPYFGLRDYGVDGQIGLERTPGGYVAELVAVFAEVRRVLRDDGTLWLNLGDSYSNDGKWGGTTGLVSKQQGCQCIGVDLNPAYCEIAARRLSQGVLEFGAGGVEQLEVTTEEKD